MSPDLRTETKCRKLTPEEFYWEALAVGEWFCKDLSCRKPCVTEGAERDCELDDAYRIRPNLYERSSFALHYFWLLLFQPNFWARSFPFTMAWNFFVNPAPGAGPFSILPEGEALIWKCRGCSSYRLLKKKTTKEKKESQYLLGVIFEIPDKHPHIFWFLDLLFHPNPTFVRLYHHGVQTFGFGQLGRSVKSQLHFIFRPL